MQVPVLGRMFPKSLRSALIVALLAIGPIASAAAPSGAESFHYSWRLRGGLAWLARLAFPTSGIGLLRNVPGASDSIQSELLITSPKGRDGFYVYRSEIDREAQRTTMSYHGYEWGSRYRKERTLFDYEKRVAHIREEDAEEIENKTRALPGPAMRDVLTGIHYLRQNAAGMQGPVRADIFSDGKMYPVVFSPGNRENYSFHGRAIPARVYGITAAPGSTRKWPGGIRLWLSQDGRSVPLRIEIQRGMTSLQLDIQSIG